MTYFKIEPGKFIEYNEATGQTRIIIRSELVAQKQALTERIATADPNQPTTNTEWIAWAKANYPYVNHSAEQQELDTIVTILETIKTL